MSSKRKNYQKNMDMSPYEGEILSEIPQKEKYKEEFEKALDLASKLLDFHMQKMHEKEETAKREKDEKEKREKDEKEKKEKDEKEKKEKSAKERKDKDEKEKYSPLISGGGFLEVFMLLWEGC